MSRVEYLREQRSRPAAVLHQFLMAYNKGTRDVFLFFEGHDDLSFYSSEIRRRWQGSGLLTCIVCNGKAGVVDAYQRVKPFVDNIRRTLFFVDKDLDDFLPQKVVRLPRSKSLYVTDYYSIENYLVSEKVLEIIWLELWSLDHQDPRLAEARVQLNECYQSFVKGISLLMAWILSKKLNSETPNINNINLGAHFKSERTFSRIRPTQDKLNSCCGTKHAPGEWKQIRRILYEFSATSPDPKIYVRGKFELWFFVKFLRQLIRRLRASPAGFKGPKIDLNMTNFLQIIAPRAPVPPSVAEFLDYNLARV